MTTKVPTRGMLVSIEGIDGPLLFMGRNNNLQQHYDMWNVDICKGYIAPKDAQHIKKFHDLIDITIYVYPPDYRPDNMIFDLRIRANYYRGDLKQRWVREYLLRTDDGLDVLHHFGPRLTVNATTTQIVSSQRLSQGFYIPDENICVLTFLAKNGEFLFLPAIVDNDTLFCPIYEIIHV